MTRLIRNGGFGAIVVALFLAAAVLSAGDQQTQQTQTNPPSQTGQQTGSAPPQPPPTAGAPASAPATPPRPITPEQKAFNDANAVTDPAKKLEALRKFQADHPTHALARSAESSIFGVLLTSFKDRESEIAESLDKQLKNIPESAPPDSRLTQLQTIVTRLVDANVLLSRSESLLTEALGKLDRAAYIKTRKESMEKAIKAAEERQKTNPATTIPTMPTDESLGQQFDRSRARPIELMARIHLASGDARKAEAEFKEALAADATLTRAPMELSKMASARGDDRAALDYQMPLMLGGRLKQAEEEAFATLFRKVRGGGGNLEAELDRLYREKFPNPIAHPEKFTGSRSGRVALLEMFTGSACPPCVAADLALDASLERYPADAIAVLAYHVHVPGPDPMTVPGSVLRNTLYVVPGVPTFNVDGARARLGGGGRENTDMVYKTYLPIIDKSLNTPADADLKVTAAIDGSRITAKATVANVKGQARDLRVHFVLAERHLTFLGENGIRFHPFVVRDVAGEKAEGYALTELNTPTTIEHTFDLTAIPDRITKSLADDIARRRKGETASPPREYRAEGKAMTAIDPSQLVVVAFVQEATNSTPPPATAPAQAATPAGTAATLAGTAATLAGTTATTGAAVTGPPAATGTGGAPAAPPAPAAQTSRESPPTYKVLQAAWVPVVTTGARK